MAKVELRILTRDDVERLMPPMADIMEVIETGLAAHGTGDVVLPPKAHIHLDERYNGHFNVLPGWAGPIDTAGVKVVGDYVDNYKHGLPSEVGLLTLYDPRTGVPFAFMDATAITARRTGAVTGVGAKYLADSSARIVGHLGARGSAFSNIESLCEQFPIEEVRINSKRRETRTALADEVTRRLGVSAVAVDSAQEAVDGADIVVEATRLRQPELLIRDEWLSPKCLLITFGWVMATDPKTVANASKIVVDDWQQCTHGGQLFPLIDSGELRRDNVHAEIGEIVSAKHVGREAGDGKIVFWHRGFAISDIMLGNHIAEIARHRDIGVVVTMFDREPE
jgi:ornithine cyclodeaminase